MPSARGEANCIFAAAVVVRGSKLCGSCCSDGVRWELQWDWQDKRVQQVLSSWQPRNAHSTCRWQCALCTVVCRTNQDLLS
jgi:hypothetical protein